MLAERIRAHRALLPQRAAANAKARRANSSARTSRVRWGWHRASPFSYAEQIIMVRFEKLTVKAQEALQDAQEVAARHENQEITPLHLLAALASQADGVVPPLLARLGIRQEVLSSDVERELGRLPKVQGFSEQRMGRALNDALERAFK